MNQLTWNYHKREKIKIKQVKKCGKLELITKGLLFLFSSLLFFLSTIYAFITYTVIINGTQWEGEKKIT